MLGISTNLSLEHLLPPTWMSTPKRFSCMVFVLEFSYVMLYMDGCIS